MRVCLLVKAFILRWHFHPGRAVSDTMFAVHPDLKEVYETVAADLGKATKTPEPAEADAYQGAYEQANVIWIQLSSFVGFIAIPNNSSRKWESQNERTWYVGNEPDLRREFKVPKNKLPPFGGMADQWRKGQLKWIGNAEWHCVYKPDKIVYQKFEKGALVGVFGFGPDAHAGRVFILKDDGSWSSGSPANLRASECVQVLKSN